MTTADIIGRARALLVSDAIKPIGGDIAAYEALEAAAAGDSDAFAAALDVLDAVTPSPFVFLGWVQGLDPTGAFQDYKRTRAEVLALMGKASMKAARTEALRIRAGHAEAAP